MDGIYFKEVEKAQLILKDDSSKIKNNDICQTILEILNTLGQTSTTLLRIGIQSIFIILGNRYNKEILQKITQLISDGVPNITLQINSQILESTTFYEDFTKRFLHQKQLKLSFYKSLLNTPTTTEKEILLYDNAHRLGVPFSLELEVHPNTVNVLENVIKDLINKKISELVISPVKGIRRIDEQKNLFSVPEYSQLYKYIQTIKKQRQSRLKYYFRHGILPKIFLLQHPCNAYVCSGAHCHAGKRGFPQKIVINTVGDVYPESDLLEERYKFGNIFESNFCQILYSYKNIRAYSEFIVLSRYVFENLVINCPFSIIPFTDLLIQKSREMSYV